jgi:hypothetical protein
VAKHINPVQARKLRNLEIKFFDRAGNALLHQKGLHVFIAGRRPQASIAFLPVALHIKSRMSLLQAAETNLRRRRWAWACLTPKSLGRLPYAEGVGLIPAQGCCNPGTSMSSSFGEL